MIFDYNPITGLNYFSNEQEFLILELPEVQITEKIIQQWREQIQKLGVALIDTSIPNIDTFSPIISNVPYEIFR